MFLGRGISISMFTHTPNSDPCRPKTSGFRSFNGNNAQMSRQGRLPCAGERGHARFLHLERSPRHSERALTTSEPRNLTFESRLLKFCLLTSTVLYTELLFRIRHTTKFYYSPEILPVNIGHLLLNSILQNRKVPKKKKSAYGKTYATTALCTKVLSCIRNTTKFLVLCRKYFVPVNIGHIIQLNLAKSENSNQKKMLMEKLTPQLLSAPKCFHEFEIPPNSWFLAGNISQYWSYYSTQSCKIGKFKQKKKCLWKNLRNNCSLHKSAFMYSKYHQIPGFVPEIFRSSQYWSYYSTQSCKIGKFQKKKKSAYGKTYATTALCTKVLS